MNEEEKKAMFQLKDLEDDKEHLVIEQRQAITTILNLVEKQQKEIEKLKDEYKREVFEHQEFVEDTKIAVQDYIKKYKIKNIISEFIPKSNHEVVLITKIEELLGE